VNGGRLGGGIGAGVAGWTTRGLVRRTGLGDAVDSEVDGQQRMARGRIKIEAEMLSANMSVCSFVRPPARSRRGDMSMDGKSDGHIQREIVTGPDRSQTNTAAAATAIALRDCRPCSCSAQRVINSASPSRRSSGVASLHSQRAATPPDERSVKRQIHSEVGILRRDEGKVKGYPARLTAAT